MRTWDEGHVSRLILGLVLLLQLSRLAVDAASKGPAADEPRHLATGAWYLATGACCLGVVDTPASTPAAAAMLLGRDPRIPLPRSMPEPHAYGVDALMAQDGAALLRARLVTLPLALAMTLAVFFLGRRLGGDTGGALAAVFTGLDPSLLGHGHLVSPDFLMAALTPLAALAALRVVERPRIGRGLVLGLALAALVLSKYSALVPGCLLFGLSLIWRGASQPKDRLPALGVAFLVAATLVLLAYRVPSLPFFYPIGLSVLRRFLSRPYPQFLLGEYGTGWPHYFLVTLLVKAPLALLVAAGLGGAAAVRSRSLGKPALALTVLPAVALLLLASASRYGIGVRHVLAVLPALALLAAPAVTWLTPRVRTGVALAALAWAAIPRDGIAYGNLLARAAGGIDRVLSDSSVDWGEDVPLLAEWRRRNPEGSLAAAVVCPVPFAYVGLTAIPLPGTTSQPGPRPRSLPADLRWVAISTMDLQGTLLPDHDRYSLFRERTPVAILGGTIRVYDVAADPEARRRLDEIVAR